MSGMYFGKDSTVDAGNRHSTVDSGGRSDQPSATALPDGSYFGERCNVNES